MAVKYRLCTVVAAALLLVAGGAFAGSGHDQAEAIKHDETEVSGGEAHNAAQKTDQMMIMPTMQEGQMMAMPGMDNLMMPAMDAARGRKLYGSKGCIACHAIHDIGGHDAPPIDAHSMKMMMNPFGFAARMWRGASTMIYMQEELGEQIEFTGEELADIIAFVHDEEEQHKFSLADIPPAIMAIMNHSHGDMGATAAHAEEIGHEHDDGDEHHTDGGDDHADDGDDHTDGGDAHSDGDEHGDNIIVLIPAEELGHGTEEGAEDHHAEGAAAHTD